ncbi:MAG: hypothetical protein HUU10_12820 [Bacteroidetes bacterium]|nr:hypothetical protein [Bacteroidota bacterium]
MTDSSDTMPGAVSTDDWMRHLPSDAGTRILASRPVVIQSLTFLHEVWLWEGVIGESLIIPVTSFAEKFSLFEIETLCRESGLINQSRSLTLQQSEPGLLFLNFNIRLLEEER